MNQENTIIRITLLTITSVTALALLIRSLLTGEDIPQGWAFLIGSAWGALLGIGELAHRLKGNSYNVNEKENDDDKKDRTGVKNDNGTK
ncbi:hypothetical protein YS40_035 [Thermus phage phiYS40]|uniref:hypothetical protein n=1 Tax=Thermus phage phiYS40 TaxID=407392 RepID=UPI0000E68999|nr:hypothetical protein YS40_035 [Thermus phage phiYS40]ABJ91429.1 hypothetical protein YS40_035 [Thermus phage phiYS40]BAK53553.1 hypothetical protein YSP_035 [Thermus phage phiYS40]